jgi:hypothetical protein
VAEWDANPVQWLVLIYTLPPEPTRVRVRDYFAAEGVAMASAAIAECESAIGDMRVGVVAR